MFKYFKRKLICGFAAPNVAPKQVVAVALPGAKVGDFLSVVQLILCALVSVDDKVLPPCFPS